MNKKYGFTLVEIMIVVLIIGLLAAIAVPNFVKARASAQKNACVDNMRQLEGAIEQYTMEGNALSTDLGTYCGTYLKKSVDELKCPADKTKSYTITDEGDGAYSINCESGLDGHVLHQENGDGAGQGSGTGG